MGAERTFPREDKRKGFAPQGFAPPPCAVTLAKCRRYRGTWLMGTLSCAGRASGGGTQSHLSCVRVGSVSSLGGGPKDKNIYIFFGIHAFVPGQLCRRAGAHPAQRVPRGGEGFYKVKGRSTWSAVSNLTSRAGELRSAPSGPDDWYRATG